ncbi:uncharacterized protein GJ701_000004 [Geothlypis trichas]
MSTLGGHLELLAKDVGDPAVPGSALDVPAAPLSTCRQLDRHCAHSPVGRAPAATSRTPRGKGRAQACGSQEEQVRRNDRGQASSDGETVSAPSAQVGAWQGCPLVASKWA